MRSVALLEGERSSEVLLEERGLLDLSDKSRVNGLLVSDSVVRNSASLSGGITEELLLGNLGLSALLTGKVSSSELLGVDTRDVDAGRSTDHVGSVDTTKGNTVDLEGTSDKKGVVLKNLEKDNTLATETTGKENKNGTGLQRFPCLVGLGHLVVLTGNGRRLGFVPLGLYSGHCKRWHYWIGK